MKKQQIAYISIGSNLGNREKYLQTARSGLNKIKGIEILRESSELENKALLFEDQPEFLNQIVEVETVLTPDELLAKLKEIETAIGRSKTFRYGPREIDLDIITYGKIRMRSESLTLPHPGLYDRPYLIKLLEDFSLSPDDILPVPLKSRYKGIRTFAVNLKKVFVYGKENG